MRIKIIIRNVIFLSLLTTSLIAKGNNKEILCPSIDFIHNHADQIIHPWMTINNIWRVSSEPIIDYSNDKQFIQWSIFIHHVSATNNQFAIAEAQEIARQVSGQKSLYAMKEPFQKVYRCHYYPNHVVLKSLPFSN